MKERTLSIDEITTDAGTQARIGLSDDTVTEYADAIAEANGSGWPLGPIDVFHDGSRYYLADGFHRTMAAIQINRASIPCRIHKGTRTDALIFGMTANDRHGLRMSRADKRRCVEWLLDNQSTWTQQKIAETAGVSLRTVAYIVAERKPQPAENAGNERANVQIAHSPDDSVFTETTEQNVQIAHSEDDQDSDSVPVSGGTQPASGRGESMPSMTAGDPQQPDESESVESPPDFSTDWKTERNRAKKTAEALMRSIGDLQEIRSESWMRRSLDGVRAIIANLMGMT